MRATPYRSRLAPHKHLTPNPPPRQFNAVAASDEAGKPRPRYFVATIIGPRIARGGPHADVGAEVLCAVIEGVPRHVLQKVSQQRTEEDRIGRQLHFFNSLMITYHSGEWLPDACRFYGAFAQRFCRVSRIHATHASGEPITRSELDANLKAKGLLYDHFTCSNFGSCFAIAEVGSGASLARWDPDTGQPDIVFPEDTAAVLELLCGPHLGKTGGAFQKVKDTLQSKGCVVLPPDPALSTHGVMERGRKSSLGAKCVPLLAAAAPNLPTMSAYADPFYSPYAIGEPLHNMSFDPKAELSLAAQWVYLHCDVSSLSACAHKGRTHHQPYTCSPTGHARGGQAGELYAGGRVQLGRQSQ